MVNTYITQFMQKYGIRDGLILSELCRKEFDAWKRLEFGKRDCQNALPFLTVKQVRAGIESLLKSGCIEFIPSPSFNRTAKYRIRQGVFNLYKKALLKNHREDEKNSGGSPLPTREDG